MRVSFYTLGCKVNQNETGALAQLFEASGYTVVETGEAADVYVVNSCTVTNFGDQKSRKWLRRQKREHPGAVTVLTGCYPQAFPEEAAAIAEADVVTGSGNRHAILQAVQQVLDGTAERVVDIRPHEKGEKFEELPMDRFAEHTRAFVKVEDGCNRRCAYCVDPPGPGPGAQPGREQHPGGAAPSGSDRLPGGGADRHQSAQLRHRHRHRTGGTGGARGGGAGHRPHPSGQSGPGYAHR